jgi:hypothetical protein
VPDEIVENVKSPDPQAFSPGEEMGELAREDCAAPPDIWRRVIEDGVQTSYLKRQRMRLASEVYKDLVKALSLERCDKCGWERKIKSHPRRVYCEIHEACPNADKGGGGEFHELIDEYFSGPSLPREDFAIPHDWKRVVVFPVTGGSEGHYVHVGYLVPDHRPGALAYGPPVFREFALLKTFRGWDYAVMLAGRIAQMMGA